MSSNPPLSCADFLERLPLFVGGDLEEDAQAQTTSHLARCEACGEAWRRAASAREALLALRGDVTGEDIDLWSGIRTALRAAEVEEATTRPAAGRLVQGPWRRVLTATAAAAAVVLTFALFDTGGTDDTVAPVDVAVDHTPAAESVPDEGRKLADAIPGFADAGTSAVPSVVGGLRKVAPGEERLGDGARYWTREQPVQLRLNPLERGSGVTPVSATQTQR